MRLCWFILALLFCFASSSQADEAADLAASLSGPHLPRSLVLVDGLAFEHKGADLIGDDKGYLVTLKKVRLTGYKVARRIELGDVSFHIEPLGDGLYRVTEPTLPRLISFPGYSGAANGALAFEIAQFEGVFSSALEDFVELSVELKNVVLRDDVSGTELSAPIVAVTISTSGKMDALTMTTAKVWSNAVWRFWGHEFHATSLTWREQLGGIDAGKLAERQRQISELSLRLNQSDWAAAEALTKALQQEPTPFDAGHWSFIAYQTIAKDETGRQVASIEGLSADLDCDCGPEEAVDLKAEVFLAGLSLTGSAASPLWSFLPQFYKVEAQATGLRSSGVAHLLLNPLQFWSLILGGERWGLPRTDALLSAWDALATPNAKLQISDALWQSLFGLQAIGGQLAVDPATEKVEGALRLDLSGLGRAQDKLEKSSDLAEQAKLLRLIDLLIGVGRPTDDDNVTRFEVTLDAERGLLVNDRQLESEVRDLYWPF